ncbi:MAG: ABC transporter substrate-binding protein [Propionicimonas sp.]|uniref:heme/hemin ABC transporter substrate-binding protein n=1 Tax=Propionicimonas sp. TaxID=1955623 RepID=UPI003D0C072D
MRRPVATGLALALAVLLTACGSAEAAGPAASASSSAPVPLASLSPAADPRSLTGPATAALTDRTVEPVGGDEQASLPATVVSKFRAGDREVTVSDTSRIVAFDLSGSIAATLWALGLGDRLVARDVSTTFPGTESLPVITREGHAVNAEAVLSTSPTLIITDGSMGPRDVVEQLADTGVPVVFVDNGASYDGAATLAREVAAAVGLPDTGERLAERITAEVDAVRAQIARLAPTDADDRLRIVFLYVRANSGVYYLLGKDSGAGALIDALGGTDVGAELGWAEAQPLTDEAVVAAKPDVILMMTDGLASAGGVDGLLAAKPALSLTPAGERRRFVDMADGDILSFGPRSAAVLAAVARAVYGEAGR